MKKIWVLRYNDGSADVWDEEKGPPSYPYIDAFDVENALKELHSDYADLLARYNALREAVKNTLIVYDRMAPSLKHYCAARAEVDRLLTEDC